MAALYAAKASVIVNVDVFQGPRERGFQRWYVSSNFSKSSKSALALGRFFLARDARTRMLRFFLPSCLRKALIWRSSSGLRILGCITVLRYVT